MELQGARNSACPFCCAFVPRPRRFGKTQTGALFLTARYGLSQQRLDLFSICGF